MNLYTERGHPDCTAQGSTAEHVRHAVVLAVRWELAELGYLV